MRTRKSQTKAARGNVPSRQRTKPEPSKAHALQEELRFVKRFAAAGVIDIDAASMLYRQHRGRLTPERRRALTLDDWLAEQRGSRPYLFIGAAKVAPLAAAHANPNQASADGSLQPEARQQTWEEVQSEREARRKRLAELGLTDPATCASMPGSGRTGLGW